MPMTDKPYHAGAVRMGRNSELTDDWTLLKQAEAAMSRARLSTKDGSMRASIGNEANGKKVKTSPGLSV